MAGAHHFGPHLDPWHGRLGAGAWELAVPLRHGSTAIRPGAGAAGWTMCRHIVLSGRLNGEIFAN